MGEIFDVLDQSKMSRGPIKGDYTTNLYPSEGAAEVGGVVYGKCMRACFFRYMGSTGQEVKLEDGTVAVPQSTRPGPKAQWIFKAGNMFEDAILEAARDARILLQGHLKISIPIAGLKLNGEVDMVFQDKNGDPVGIEVKSVHGSMAESHIIGTAGMRRKGLKGEPKPEHVIQTAIYAWHLREQIPRFKLLYIMRGKCFREEFEVIVKKDAEGRRQIYIDGKLWKYFNLDDVFDRYKKLAFNINSGKLPGRDYTLLYDDDAMNQLLKDGKLTRGVKADWTKYWGRETDHAKWTEADKELRGKEPRRLKRPLKGDWQCSYCDFQSLCWKKDASPRK